MSQLQTSAFPGSAFASQPQQQPQMSYAGPGAMATLPPSQAQFMLGMALQNQQQEPAGRPGGQGQEGAPPTTEQMRSATLIAMMTAGLMGMRSGQQAEQARQPPQQSQPQQPQGPWQGAGAGASDVNLAALQQAIAAQLSRGEGLQSRPPPGAGPSNNTNTNNNNTGSVNAPWGLAPNPAAAAAAAAAFSYPNTTSAPATPGTQAWDNLRNFMAHTLSQMDATKRSSQQEPRQ